MVGGRQDRSTQRHWYPICLLSGLVMVSALLAGCGSENEHDPVREPNPAAQSKPSRKQPIKSSEIVKLCADMTGQEIFAEGPPVAGFVACLRRLDAPTSVISAWQSG